MANENLKTVSINGIGMDVPEYTAGDHIAITNNVISADLTDIEEAIDQLEAYLGMMDDDVYGLQVDYANKALKRLGGATGKTAGADFDAVSLYSKIKRCTVADNGTVNSYYGDVGYTEDGSNGQVMVYVPKFYYRVMPSRMDKQETGIGYHLRKCNYYITENERPGFKLHPAFYDANGEEIDYFLHSAFEGSLFDTSANTYLYEDEQVMDATTDKFCSIANVRPASGITQVLSRENIEKMAQNRGSEWHLENAKTASAIQWLMFIEAGSMNTQTAYGSGVVSIVDGDSNMSSYTGSTTNLGASSGSASATKDYNGDMQTADGKVSVSYRGIENFWGNIWGNLIGINIYGNGSMNFGEPYICKNFTFSNSNTADYEPSGFTCANVNGYINAMGYSKAFDWLLMPSETGGNSALPVGDYHWGTPNLNGIHTALLGGRWSNGAGGGGFGWDLDGGVSTRYRHLGGRLVYIPTAA